ASPNATRSVGIAQRLLMLLGTLGHNLLIWSRRWLCRHCSPSVASRLRHYGMKRMVRDLYAISGILTFDRKGRLSTIALPSCSSLAQLIHVPLHLCLSPFHIAV